METEQTNLIDLRKIFTAKMPKLMKHMPEWLFRKIQRLLHEDDINEILTKYADKEGIDFINAVVADFNLNLVLKGVDNLMASDRVLVASNHPLGGLDGIALVALPSGVVDQREPQLCFAVALFGSAEQAGVRRRIAAGPLRCIAIVACCQQ